MLAVAAAALLWRRSRPIAVTAFVMAIMIGWAIAGYGDGQDLALIVAIYAVGRYTTDHRHSLATLVAVIAVSILGTIIDTNQRIDIAPAVILAGLPWYLGRRIRNRGDYLALLQERAERLEADQHARARQAVADERSRIARELHDVVAHQVSMMTVQAGAAKTIARDDLDAAIDAMGDVERAGRQALGELRHLLGVLRPDDPDGDDLGPQPGLADIPALADQLTHTGADVIAHHRRRFPQAFRPPSTSPPIASSRNPSPTSSNTPDPTPPSTSPSASTTSDSSSTSPTPPPTERRPDSPHPDTASPACANAPPSSAAPSPPRPNHPTASVSMPASPSNWRGHDHPRRRRRRPGPRASWLRHGPRPPARHRRRRRSGQRPRSHRRRPPSTGPTSS